MNLYKFFIVPREWYIKTPQPCVYYFQDSASPQMEALIALHDSIMFYLVIILFGVTWIVVHMLINYANNKPLISIKITLIEFIKIIFMLIAMLISLWLFPFKVLLMDQIDWQFGVIPPYEDDTFQIDPQKLKKVETEDLNKLRELYSTSSNELYNTLKGGYGFLHSDPINSWSVNHLEWNNRLHIRACVERLIKIEYNKINVLYELESRGKDINFTSTKVYKFLLVFKEQTQ